MDSRVGVIESPLTSEVLSHASWSLTTDPSGLKVGNSRVICVVVKERANEFPQGTWLLNSCKSKEENNSHIPIARARLF